MSQSTAPHVEPSFLLRFDELKPHALDEVLQACLADPQLPIPRRWIDVLLTLRRKVSELLAHPNPARAMPR